MLSAAVGYSMSIPVVNVSGVLSSVIEKSPVLQQLHNAFTTVGFVFITGHGIPREMIDRVFVDAKQFFSLPQDCKSRYSRTADSANNGYVSLMEERIDSSKPGDLKECFNVTSVLKDCIYPDAEVPSMRPDVKELFQICSNLALTLLRLMGHALKLEVGYPDDVELFVKSHQKMNCGSDLSLTTLRLLHYPPVPADIDIAPGQLRCGEHVDYGSITLLFQDPNGGLQVKCAGGEYINVPYHSDAVLVNLGALMQNWTSDVYMATPHRVLLPEEESEKRSVRQSLAFFCHPDNEVVVECVDGSNKYPPVRADEDCWDRLNKTYKY